MVTLCLDSAHHFLAIALLKDGAYFDGVLKKYPRQQSEYIMEEISEIFQKHTLKPTMIDSVVVSNGPGSFTGVRIALTVAKIISSQLNIPLYTLSTLQLYAGLDDVEVILDARSNRIYYGKFQAGTIVIAPTIKELSDFKPTSSNLIGDLEVIGETSNFPNYLNNFALLKDFYHLEENIDTAVPLYLKSDEAYRK